MENKALVLFSGGQDSTVCLAWALQRYDQVATIGFDYGQRHRVELDCRNAVLREIGSTFPQWEEKLGDDHLLDLDVLGRISDTSLTSDAAIRFSENGLPTTFIPGRNLLFFTLAAAVAYRRDAHHLIGGMCETDYSGYPDCRDATLRALEVAIALGMDRDFKLHTPLMWIDKSETWALAKTIGGEDLIQIIIEHTHTCYLGDRRKRHVWGYGCNDCPACELRREGYERFTLTGNS